MIDCTRIVSWNIAHRIEPWRVLVASGVDAALLQEAQCPPPDVRDSMEIDAVEWRTEGAAIERPWRTAVVGLSDRVQLRHRSLAPLTSASRHEMAVSVPGALAVADMEIIETGEVITLASLYGLWETPVAQAESTWIYADASVHRLISDLSALIGRQRGHKLIAAGDLNVLYGYGEQGSPYWKARYDTIFARMEALGLRFVGPQAPDGGIQAEPWPAELPPDSHNVPTYRTRQKQPETGTRQLDFVFASAEIYDRVGAWALNAPEDWGPSDHCRVMIELEG